MPVSRPQAITRQRRSSLLGAPLKQPRCFDGILDRTRISPGEIGDDHHVLGKTARDTEGFRKLAQHQVASVEVGPDHQMRVVKLARHEPAVVPPLSQTRWRSTAHASQRLGQAGNVINIHWRGFPERDPRVCIVDQGGKGRWIEEPGGAAMSELTQDEALRQADALVEQALRETEARCGVLGQYINDCDNNGSHTAAWSEALRELHGQQGYRRGLMRRHSLIQQALDCPVGERPATVPLTPPPNRAAGRTQQQVQIRARRRT